MNSRQFLIVIVITFVVGMVWLIADILFNTKASIPISDKLQSSLEPITPTFNTRILGIIENETISRNQITVRDGAAPEPSVEIIEPAGSPEPSPSDTPPALNPSLAPAANPGLTPLITLPNPATGSGATP